MIENEWLLVVMSVHFDVINLLSILMRKKNLFSFT